MSAEIRASCRMMGCGPIPVFHGHEGRGPLKMPDRAQEADGASQDNLAHVRFIGGGNAAGKTTVARRLAAHHHLYLYDAEAFSRYLPRTAPETAPLFHAFVATDMDERWLNRTPRVIFE